MKVSDQARAQIKSDSNYLVILVEIGGCKGFWYNYFYTKEIDNYFLLDDIILTDEYSMPFLLNITLDYESDIGYEDFVIYNENLEHCNCGKSFNA